MENCLATLMVLSYNHTQNYDNRVSFQSQGVSGACHKQTPEIVVQYLG
jgi:hypothetical protein